MLLIAILAACLAPLQGPASSPAVFERALPALPEPVTSLGAAVLGKELYVLGGHAGAPHDYARENQSRNFLRLDLTVPTDWKLLAVRERGIQSAVLVENGRALFAIGGMEARNARGEPLDLWSVREARRFDPARQVWTPLPDLPAARSSHAAAIAGSRLWVIGGWNLAGGDLESGGTFSDECWSLDLAHADQGWLASPVPFQRRGLGAAANSSTLAAIGGMEADGKPSKRVDLLDLRTTTWKRGPDLPEEGFGCAALALGERVFASTSSGAVWELAPGLMQWNEVARLDFPRRFHQLVALDKDTLLAVGGTCSGQRIGHLERVHLERNPATRIAGLNLSTAAAARNRQAMWVCADSLFVFGGNTGTVQHDFAPERFTSEGWKLELGSLAWTRLADLPVRRQSLVALATAGGGSLVAGGFGRSETGTRSFAESFSYDACLDKWKPAAALDVPRTQFALLADAGKSYVLGGMDFDDSRAKDERFAYPLSILERGPEGEFQSTHSVLPRPRRAFGSAVQGGAAYLVGGMADGFEPVEVCDVYDFAQKTWSVIPSPRKPRISPDLLSLGGRLYLIGGSTTGEDGELRAERSIECFDPRTQGWSVFIEDVGVDVQQARAFVHRGRLLLVSTQHGPEAGLALTWIAPRVEPAAPAGPDGRTN